MFYFDLIIIPKCYIYNVISSSRVYKFAKSKEIIHRRALTIVSSLEQIIFLRRKFHPATQSTLSKITRRVASITDTAVNHCTLSSLFAWEKDAHFRRTRWLMISPMMLARDWYRTGKFYANRITHALAPNCAKISWLRNRHETLAWHKCAAFKSINRPHTEVGTQIGKLLYSFFNRLTRFGCLPSENRWPCKILW